MVKNSEKVGILELLMSILKVKSKSMRSLLDVNRKTLKNYRKRSDEELPKEVKEELVKVFSLPNVEKIRQYIEKAKECKITYKEAKEKLNEYLSKNKNQFDVKKFKVRDVDMIIQEEKTRNNFNRKW